MLVLGLATSLQAQSIPAYQPQPWARWDSSDWLAVGAVAGVSAGSFLVEEQVRVAFQQHRSGVSDVLERVGFWYGTPLFTVPATLLTLGAGEILNDPDVSDTGVLMSQLLLSALFVQQPIRITVGRARPLTGEGHWSFRPFTLGNDYASFVSGHSWSAFGISNIVARQIDQAWASVTLYTLATITALSRLYSDNHWLTDVVLGSVIGYAISTELWNRRHEDSVSPEAALQAPSRRWLMISFPL
jgi:membrane-associated phospholipid phosphatase